MTEIVIFIVVFLILVFSPHEEAVMGEIEIDYTTDDIISIEESSSVDINDTNYPAINLQNTVDTWANQIVGQTSVMIYDIERGEIIAMKNPDEIYNMASLYKLFVVYEGYVKIQNGEWNSESLLGATGKTILECLDLSIRESNSTCGETLWQEIGYQALEQKMHDYYGIREADFSDLTSNVWDIVRILKIFYKHHEISDSELLTRMKDSFLNQPMTEYDWRQGLPSGFSDKFRVYNKVGWDYDVESKNWNVYHDATIIETPDSSRHFIVVVMTRRVDYWFLRRLGSEIEKAITSI